MPVATLDGMEGPRGALTAEYWRHLETERGLPQNTIRVYQADLTGLVSVARVPPGWVTLAYLCSWLAD